MKTTDDLIELICSKELKGRMPEKLSLQWQLCPKQKGFTVRRQGEQVHISAGRRVELFRALGLVAEHGAENEYFLEQKPHFQTDGVMLDCSRNGVMKVSVVKELIHKMALMGLDMLMLYTEDTYEIKEYPYFGYMRGRYSAEEIREIDDYAAGFGIELIPCIQTLAHLARTLQWSCFDKVRDTEDILLCGEEETYRLIEEMIRTCRETYRTRRIHIGMDEAAFLGFGKYRIAHKNEERIRIFGDHLRRVAQICKKYDFRPMMWGDMFFVTAFEEYNNKITREMKEMVPSEVQLVAWEYYQESQENYAEYFRDYAAFDNETIFAGGAWRWVGFAPAIEHSLFRSREALRAAKACSLKEVMLTAWGDDGNEASFFSILPVMQLFAEYNYTGETDDAVLSKRLYACTGESLPKMLLLDLPNQPDKKKHLPHQNAGKYLLYQDIMSGLMDKHTREDYGENYKDHAKQLTKAATEGGDYAYIYETLADLCCVLEIKSTIGVRIKAAYDAKNRELLKYIKEEELPELGKRLTAFHQSVRKQWMCENKVFGYEVLDIRLGGLKARLNSAKQRLEEYLNGETDRLAELEEERLYHDCQLQERADGEICNTYNTTWARAVTACKL